MNRKAFLGCCGVSLLSGAEQPPSEADREKTFVTNWMTDLFATMETELDQATKVKIMAGCGKACFARHEFKTNIAKLGKGDVDRLVEAYQKNFRVTRQGDEVHIRFGGSRCFCPAAKYHPPLPNDMHCECTRATHQAIFETALERPVDVQVVESLRRGGKGCHFVAKLV